MGLGEKKQVVPEEAEPPKRDDGYSEVWRMPYADDVTCERQRKRNISTIKGESVLIAKNGIVIPQLIKENNCALANITVKKKTDALCSRLYRLRLVRKMLMCQQS